MAPRRKRQRLDEAGNEKDSTAPEVTSPKAVEAETETPLSHAKSQRSQLFVRSLAPSTTNEDLTEHFSQSFPIKHAVVVTDPTTKTCKGYGFVTFTDAEDAQRAKEEFDGSSLLGKVIKVEVAERRQREEGKSKDGVAGEDKVANTKTSTKPDNTVQPAPKLIVRNLPWSINTPDKLEALFRSYGKIKQAIVPKNDKGQMKGFGIVLIRGKKNAEKAIEKVNGKELDGRTLAIDWAVDRETWDAVKEQEEEQKEGDEVKQEDEDGAHDRLDQMLEDEIDGEDLNGKEESDDDAQDLEDHDEEDEEELDEHDEEEDEIKLSTNTPHRPDVSDATLFIRNLPFNCADEDLEDHFSQFGDVRYARVVVDRDTGRPKGTGFVCFRQTADADQCIRDAPRQQTAPKAASKKDTLEKIGGRSVLQNEALDPTEQFTMDGRVLQITRAVNKSEAARLTAEGTAQRNVRDKDKRRLYLLHEGTIASNSPLYQQLSGPEIAMRDASLKQRKSFVEKNPALHLSLTRLAIRNIPRSVTSKDLKSLAREAVVEFAKDVKSGKRQPLSKEELSRGGEEMIAAEKERRAKGKGLVRQAKVVFEGREGEKIEESAGAGRSRGYGFVEYYTHRNALMGLRWLNGHAVDYQALASQKKSKVTKEDLQDRRKRIIVEFALENATVMQRRQDREEKVKERPKGKGKGQGDTGIKNGTKHSHDNKKPRKPNGKEADSKARVDGEEATGKGDKADKGARRQQIIGRKRALRRDRKAGKA